MKVSDIKKGALVVYLNYGRYSLGIIIEEKERSFKVYHYKGKYIWTYDKTKRELEYFNFKVINSNIKKAPVT